MSTYFCHRLGKFPVALLAKSTDLGPLSSSRMGTFHGKAEATANGQEIGPPQAVLSLVTRGNLAVMLPRFRWQGALKT